MNKKHIYFLTLLLYIFCLISCQDASTLLETNTDIPQQEWRYENVLPFDVDIEDTTQTYNVYISVRHTDSYPYSNLWVMIHTTFPSGKKLEQQVDLPLANKKGKWHGRGSGTIFSTQIMIQEKAIFNEQGKYIFEIEQNMRMNPLIEVLDVGMRVEKSN